jgi:DNA gyrase subunit A
VNGANGIAVGLATNIPTHNLGEVIDGVCAYIDNPRISLADMMKIIPGPDFSTGGYIIANELKQAYETGKGKITLRAKYAVENGDYGKKLIVFTELPYQTNKAELLRKIMLLKEDKKELLSGIADIVDESDRTGMRAVISCRKDADVDAILAYLFKYTDLECTFGINMVAIAGGKPQQLGLLDIIKHYVAYQRQVIIRRTKFELKEAEARCHILEGLIIGVHNIDEVIKIIKSAESTADARTKLMDRFALTERQAQAILDLRLARLAKLEIKKLEEELAALKLKIEELKAILDSKDKQMDIVKSEMREIKKKYPCPRRTRIVDAVTDISVMRQDVKRAVCDWAVCITSNDALKFIEREEFLSKCKKPLSANAKADTIFKQVIFTKSEGTVYAFTNYGNCVKLTLDELDCTDFKGAAVKLKSIYDGAMNGEIPVKIFDVSQGMPSGDVVFFTSQGSVKRTAWSEYALTKAVFPAIKMKAGDEVVNVENYVDDELSTMCFVSEQGMFLNAVKDEVPVQGRIAGGVRGMMLNDGDKVIFATQINGEGEIIIVTAQGTFKRVISSLIDPIARGRKGLMITDSKSTILFADYVTLPYNLAIINDDKTIAEIETEDIQIDSRVSKGKVIKRDEIKTVKGVVSLKYKSPYEDGKMQIKF